MGSGASSDKYKPRETGWEVRGEPAVYTVGSSSEASASFIFLHGFTGGPDTSLGWSADVVHNRPSPEAQEEAWKKCFAALPCGMRMVHPKSPATRAAQDMREDIHEVFLGEVMGGLVAACLDHAIPKVNSWFDDVPLEEWATPGKLAASPDVAAWIAYVHGLIRQEVEAGVPANRIIVGGFSQGGIGAFRAALTFPDAALGGLVALGASEPYCDRSIAVAEAQEALPVWLGAGDQDPCINWLVHVLAELPKDHPAGLGAFTAKTYPGFDHTVLQAPYGESQQNLDLLAFVEKALSA